MTSSIKDDKASRAKPEDLNRPARTQHDGQTRASRGHTYHRSAAGTDALATQNLPSNQSGNGPRELSIDPSLKQQKKLSRFAGKPPCQTEKAHPISPTLTNQLMTAA